MRWHQKSCLLYTSALRGELPLEVQDLEDEIIGLNTRMEKIENEINEFQYAVSQKKSEIEQAQMCIRDRYYIFCCEIEIVS